MLQKINDTVYCIADEFSNHAWVHNNIRDSYISLKPRTRYRTSHGGVLMWTIIIVGYFLYMMPFILSLPLVVISISTYRYFDLSLFKDRDQIILSRYNDTVICTGASGYERRRIQRIGAKHHVKVIFEKAHGQSIILSRRYYHRRCY